MKKVKIVDSNFDRETGISYVTIQTPKGMFTGYSKLQEEDIPYTSIMAGCRYAELKAHIKMIEADIKETKSQLSAFRKFYNNTAMSNKFNSSSYEARKLRREMYSLEEKIKSLESLKASIHKTLMNAIDNRQKEVDAIHRGVEILRKKRGQTKTV